ncbi:hypothetical protein BTVI_35299 [Pitangus sulphuratus]|nr:hypothetical protein BTVI_35299 [Pitangus sulphuratus]
MQTPEEAVPEGLQRSPEGVLNCRLEGKKGTWTVSFGLSLSEEENPVVFGCHCEAEYFSKIQRTQNGPGPHGHSGRVLKEPQLLESLRARNVWDNDPWYNFPSPPHLKLITDLSTENHQVSEKKCLKQMRICLRKTSRPTIEGGVSEVEIISQQVEEETKSIAPVQLVNFAYRDLPLAALDLSVAGSQLLSNLDEEYQREGLEALSQERLDKTSLALQKSRVA